MAWSEHRVELAAALPFEPSNVFGHLAATAVPGVEEWRDGWYRRTLRLPGGPAVVALRPTARGARPGGESAGDPPGNHDDVAEGRFWLSDPADLAAATARCRFLLDLDVDPVAVDAHLSRDPLLAPLVARAPGRRVPRTTDGEELAIRAILGQQVSTAAARTHAGRLVAAEGERFDDPGGGLTHLFPSMERLAAVDPETLALPRTRRATLTSVAAALASGEVVLDPAGDWTAARSALLGIRGVGPWTVETVAMRALGDPDAFLGGDLGIVAALRGLGAATTPAAVAAGAAGWSPWRSYAVQYLWATGTHAVNHLPG